MTPLGDLLNYSQVMCPPVGAPGKLVVAPFTKTGLTWPGGTNSLTYSFSHGLATPAGALYFVQYIDLSGSTFAATQIQSPGTTGCTVSIYNPLGNPPNGTGYDLYILAVLQY